MIGMRIHKEEYFDAAFRDEKRRASERLVAAAPQRLREPDGPMAVLVLGSGPERTGPALWGLVCCTAALS